MLDGLFGALTGRWAARDSRSADVRGLGDPFADTLRIRGDLVTLRPLSPDDAPAMFTYASDTRVTQYLPWEPAASVDSVRPFLEDQAARRSMRESLGLAILDNESGQMIGSTDLMDLRRVRGYGEIGYLLAQPFWGRGIMTEAAALTLQHGFGPLRLARIVAHADVENRASRRVLEKLGMVVVGSEMRKVHGDDRLYIRYEIRRSGWRARNESDHPQ